MDTHTNMLINLEVISGLEKMDKLNTFYNVFQREKPGVLTTMKRWIRDDSKDRTVNAIHRLVRDSIIAIKEKKYNDIQLYDLYRYTVKAKRGLQNLLSTYNEYDAVTAHITIIINEIEKLEDKYREIWPLAEQYEDSGDNEEEEGTIQFENA